MTAPIITDAAILAEFYAAPVTTDTKEAMRLVAEKLGVDLDRVEAAVWNDLYGMQG